MVKKLFDMLVPIIYVKDLQSEKQFYLDLGFEISYEGKKFPNFMGIKCGDKIEFGLEKRENLDIEEVNKLFFWQMTVNDLNKLKILCNKKGIKILRNGKVNVRKDWQYSEITIESPNGYKLNIEGPNES